MEEDTWDGGSELHGDTSYCDVDKVGIRSYSMNYMLSEPSAVVHQPDDNWQAKNIDHFFVAPSARRTTCTETDLRRSSYNCWGVQFRAQCCFSFGIDIQQFNLLILLCCDVSCKSSSYQSFIHVSCSVVVQSVIQLYKCLNFKSIGSKFQVFVCLSSYPFNLSPNQLQL